MVWQGLARFVRHVWEAVENPLFVLGVWKLKHPFLSHEDGQAAPCGPVPYATRGGDSGAAGAIVRPCNGFKDLGGAGVRLAPVHLAGHCDRA
jgi:hypothetical protein